ncbi:MAG TPA: hypothetical protein VJB82_00995 [Candidatus Peribacterales bacterium]|nr:hypothetical protein [Candidatus Peribacterales bacterium]
MNITSSHKQIAALSPIHRVTLHIIPLLQAAFAVLIVAQHNGYPIGF